MWARDELATHRAALRIPAERRAPDQEGGNCDRRIAADKYPISN
jgi:hypothetical protein